MLTSSNDALKRLAAHEALQFLKPGMVLGVGTGSTVNHFIALIHAHQIAIDAAVSSSNASSELLRSLGIRVIDPNTVEHLPLYVDGADEVDPRCRLIKGGGGALTREKILADLAERFVCIVDEAKCVPVLGGFPLPIEVLALARAQVTRKLEALGAKVRVREGFSSDNGHPIIDAAGLSIDDPVLLEATINQWPGVVSVGLFAARAADLVLVAGKAGVRALTPERQGDS